MSKPIISIVIPTYNRRKYLNSILNSLNEMEFKKEDYEIIVVDDGSTDGTEQIIVNCNPPEAEQIANLRYFRQEHKGASAARNLGIKSAKGEIIAFTDSDCIADKNWLKEIVKSLCSGIKESQLEADESQAQRSQGIQGSFNNKEAIAVGGRTTSISEKITPFTHQVITDGKTFTSCNMAVRKEILLKMGGFDEDFIYGHEDTDIYFRLQKLGKIIYNPSAIVCHPPIPLSFLQFIRRIEISYRNEKLLYKKYPELYERRSFISAIIRVIGIRAFILQLNEWSGYFLKNPFKYLLFLLGLLLQRVYLSKLIINNKESKGC
ncbi:glycosyltransferase family 2 protein [candidate division WOR-3 bacterium]|nr:glycosyltransferase family 2 protein [candidate division WOR-3 bacterium]